MAGAAIGPILRIVGPMVAGEMLAGGGKKDGGEKEPDMLEQATDDAASATEDPLTPTSALDIALGCYETDDPKIHPLKREEDD